MAQIAELTIGIGADIQDFQSKLGKLQQGLTDAGKKMKDMGKGLTLGVTTPIVGMGTAIVMTTANFESSMNKVRAISGATGEEFAALEKQAIDLGGATVFSAKEAADGMSFLAMAGFEVNDIMAAMPGMLDLAASAQMDLASAADIASNIMSGFTLEASQAGYVADVLAKASSSANTDVYQLGEAMKYVAPVANALDISMEETAAAIGFMSDAGIQGSQAGTALRGILSRLTKPSKQAADLMDTLGVELFDAEGNMKSLAGITEEFTEATKNLTQEEKANAIATIFGQEAMSGFLAIMDRGSGELSEFTDELMNSSGTAEEMANIMNSGLAGAWEELSGALETAAINLGKILAPVLEKIAFLITELIGWFDGLSNETKTAILIVAGLAAALGPLLIALGFISMALGALSAPILLVVGLVGGLVAAFIAAYSSSETFRDIVKKAFDAVKRVISQAIKVAVKVIEAGLNAMTTVWERHGKDILSTIETAFKLISSTISSVLTVIGNIFSGFFTLVSDIWTAYGETILMKTQEVFGLIVEAIQIAVANIFLVIQTVFSVIQEFWILHGQTILENTAMVFGAVYEAIRTALETAWEIIQVVWTSLMEFWNEHGERIVETTSTIFTNIYNAISNALTIIWEIVQTVLELIREFWSKHGERIMKLVTTVFTTVWDIISSIINAISEFISSALEKIRVFWDKHGESIMTIIKTAMNIIGSVIGAAMDVVLGIFNTVWPTIRNVTETVWNTITSIISGAVDIISNIIGFFVDIFSGDFAGAWKSVEGIVTGVVDTVTGVFKGMINLVIDGINFFIRGINKLSWDVPDWVPLLGGKKFGFDLPEIPKLAEGGITTGPTLAWIGEGKEQEAVLPLSKLEKLINLHRGDDDDPDPEEVEVEYNFEIPVVVDGREFGRASAKFSKQELDQQKRKRKRLKGKI